MRERENTNNYLLCLYIYTREMLTDTFKVIINNLFKESFYKKKKIINVLTVFFISYKSGFKIFLKYIYIYIYINLGFKLKITPNYI